MGAPRIPADLPADYVVREDRRGVLAVRREYAQLLEAAGYGAGGGERLEQSDLSGRRPLFELNLDGERLVVRRFHHGGALRWMTGARYADPARPFRELQVSAALAEGGLATPTVVAARALRAPVGGWFLDLVTRRVEDTLDLAEWLERLRGGDVPFERRRRTVRGAGEFVGRLHAFGLVHPDLNPRNLLLNDGALAGEEPRLWVLDLDRAVLRRPVEAAARRRNLRRLLRALLRREGRGARFFWRTDLRRFLAGYGVGLGDAVWKEEWRSVQADLERHSPAHRIWWRVEQAFGGGPDTRDGRAAVRREIR